MTESISPGPLGSEQGSWCTANRFALLLAGFICAAYPDVILGGQVFYFRDFGFFGYPLAYHHRQSFWQGEIPLWNPYNNCGLPFLAQWNTLVLYPGSFLYLVLPPVWALSLFCLLHLWLAGMGMYCLAYRWTRHRLGAAVAGTAFALNGLALNCLMWPNNIAALGWMAWVVLAAERAWTGGRRQWALAVVVGAVQMLTGAPEIILFTWLIAAGVALLGGFTTGAARWHLMARFTGLVVAVAALAAVQLLPFLDLLRHSERHQDFGVSTWAMPGTGWANLLVPLFYCFRGRHGVFFQVNQNWTSSYYLGIGVVALAVIGFLLRRNSRVWLLSGIGLLGLVLALGAQSFVYSGLHAVVPQIGFMRFQIKFVLLTLFAVPALAAHGVACVLRTDRETLPRARKTLLFVGTLLTLAIGGLLVFAWLQPPPWGAWARTAWSGLSRALLLWAALGALLALPRFRGFVSASLVSLGLVILLAVDALTHTSRQNPTVPRVAFSPGAVQIEPRPRLGESRAMMSPAAYRSYDATFTSNPLNDYVVGRAGLFNNANLVEEIPEVSGFFSLYFPEERTVWYSLYRREVPKEVPRLLDFLGVSQRSAAGQVYRFEHRATALPWATAGQRPVYADPEAAARAVREGQFDLGEVVVLPPQIRGVVTVTNRTFARIVASEFTAHQATLRVEAAEPSLVVVSQTCSPRWRFYIDGARAVGCRANHAFVAVQVPAGRHTVKLMYWDTRFHAGVMVSLLTLVGCMAVLRPNPHSPVGVTTRTSVPR